MRTETFGELEKGLVRYPLLRTEQKINSVIKTAMDTFEKSFHKHIQKTKSKGTEGTCFKDITIINND